ncbi:unnamed protein product [Dovyalis caffra]|uniref:Uncharacterized protein n=1 Tax=Dovyalis caffra TaxID=77055 RepID=A0AAV1S507_9ROSI|nr:unnamed protein product [Dovyalis caffra]
MDIFPFRICIQTEREPPGVSDIRLGNNLHLALLQVPGPVLRVSLKRRRVIGGLWVSTMFSFQPDNFELFWFCGRLDKFRCCGRYLPSLSLLSAPPRWPSTIASVAAAPNCSVFVGIQQSKWPGNDGVRNDTSATRQNSSHHHPRKHLEIKFFQESKRKEKWWALYLKNEKLTQND